MAAHSLLDDWARQEAFPPDARALRRSLSPALGPAPADDGGAIFSMDVLEREVTR